jgi:putative membrane protein
VIKLIRNFINGLAFGVTQIVPGVSGGTVAIIMGFYDELLWSVNHFREDWRKAVKFLAPLVLGTVSGIVLFSSLIKFLLDNFSFQTMAFFIGLIVGIIPLIHNKAVENRRDADVKKAALILIPIILLVAVAHIKDIIPGADSIVPEEVIKNAGIPYMAVLFFAGTAAAAALVIPGLSGSFILLLIGVYYVITASLSSIGVYLRDIRDLELLLGIIKILAPLGVGIIIGGLSMARLIETLLANHGKTVYSVILGLLIGSVYALFKEPIMFSSRINAPAVLIAIVAFVIGCFVSYKLGKKRL